MRGDGSLCPGCGSAETGGGVLKVGLEGLAAGSGRWDQGKGGAKDGSQGSGLSVCR